MTNELYPKTAPTKLQFAALMDLYQQEQYADLLSLSETFRRDYPTDLKLQNIIGSAWAGLGEYQKSIDILKSIVRADPTYANALHNLGLTYLHSGQLENAIESLNIAISLKPKSSKFLNSLGAAHFEAGHTKEAVETLQTAVALDNKNAMLHVRLGEYLLALGSHDAARNSLERALAINPANGQTMILLGEALIKLDLPQDAMTHLSAASEICPNDPDLYMTMARFWRKYKQPSKELDALDRVIKLRPEHSEGYAVLAEALANHGDKTSALAAYQKCLEVDPRNAEARHFLAALQGENTAGAPKEYVANLFDQYASSFEQSLTIELGYQVPNMIAELLSTYNTSGAAFDNTLDLGCGSGLVGQAVSSLVGCIDGVDLSKNMISIAREKAIYNQLEVGDITEAVIRNPQQYDLYIAADVLIYLGDMEELFSAFRNNAKSGAMFIFTTELNQTRDYELLPTGRYSHSKEYITKLCQKNNMEIISMDGVDLRKEAGSVLAGNLYSVRMK